MAYTTVATANQVSQWDADFFEEYTRDTQFSPYFGTSENSIIQTKENLTKAAGDKITVSFVAALSGAGVTGSSTLEGFEESQTNYGHQLTVDKLRNAVLVDDMEELRTVIDVRGAAKSGLKTWMMTKMRDSLIDALQSPVVDGKTTYANSTSTQRNAYAAANSDRLLFGIGTSNYSATFATGLATLDSTNDKLTPATLSLAKRMARVASPKIRPIQTGKTGEWYVMFADYRAFRDLKLHATIQSAWQYAQPRGSDNPLFNDGDIVWDGVIVKEVPEIPTIATNTVTCFLCGAQALGVAWAKRSKTVVKLFDYDAKYGVAVSEVRAVERLMFNSKQNGVVTLYLYGAND